jgi:hypothetical protein
MTPHCTEGLAAHPTYSAVISFGKVPNYGVVDRIWSKVGVGGI